MHKSIVYIFVLLFSSLIFGQTNEGIFIVVSGKVTSDGLPLLCQNLDRKISQVSLRHFVSKGYDFTGVISGSDTTRVWMGQNSVGFALVATPADLAEDNNGIEGLLVKKALGLCGRVEDFTKLLDEEKINAPINFGAIDAFGNAVAIEYSGGNLSTFDANDPLQVRDGYLVRSNFSFSRSSQKAGGSFRYHRAVELLEQHLQNEKLDNRVVLQHVLRDVATEEVNPYPLTTNRIRSKKIKPFATLTSINRYNTVSAMLFRGFINVNRESVAWCALGQPITTIFIPVNVRCQPLHPDVSGEKNSRLNELAEKSKKLIYPIADSPDYLDVEKLISGKFPLLETYQTVESDLMARIEKQQQAWVEQSQAAILDRCHFLKTIISKAIIQIR